MVNRRFPENNKKRRPPLVASTMDLVPNGAGGYKKGGSIQQRIAGGQVPSKETRNPNTSPLPIKQGKPGAERGFIKPITGTVNSNVIKRSSPGVDRGFVVPGVGSKPASATTSSARRQFFPVGESSVGGKIPGSAENSTRDAVRRRLQRKLARFKAGS